MTNYEMLEQIQRMFEEKEKPLNANEACKFLGISKSYLYALTHKREIRFSKPNGKIIYFAKSDLIDWMLRKQVKTKDEIDDEASNYVTFN